MERTSRTRQEAEEALSLASFRQMHTISKLPRPFLRSQSYASRAATRYALASASSKTRIRSIRQVTFPGLGAWSVFAHHERKESEENKMTKGTVPSPLELSSTAKTPSGKFASSVLLRSPACPSPDLARFPSLHDDAEAEDDEEKALWAAEGPAAAAALTNEAPPPPVYKVVASVSFC